MTTPPNTRPTTPRLNLKLTPTIDAMLREIAADTGLKLVTIIAKGIETEHKRWKEGKR